MTLSNGVLVHYPNPGPGDADLSFTLTKPQLLTMLAGGGPEGVAHQGDPGALQRLLSVLDTPLPPSRSSHPRLDRGDCETGTGQDRQLLGGDLPPGRAARGLGDRHASRGRYHPMPPISGKPEG
jgi:Alkyl sulfatase C-terminal